jgi:hypothetical protein
VPDGPQQRIGVMGRQELVGGSVHWRANIAQAERRATGGAAVSRLRSPVGVDIIFVE